MTRMYVVGPSAGGITHGFTLHAATIMILAGLTVIAAEVIKVWAVEYLIGHHGLIGGASLKASPAN